jgi:hypothetical protein
MTKACVVATGGAAADIPDFPMATTAGRPFDPPPALRALEARAPITKGRLWDGMDDPEHARLRRIVTARSRSSGSRRCGRGSSGSWRA